MDQEILNKHRFALDAAYKYWISNEPTGISDRDFDKLERDARADGLELRDYVRRDIQGTRVQNADYIGKVEKTTVEGSMMEKVRQVTMEYRELTGEDLYWTLKYDGSSLAAYYDTRTGEPRRVITIGGSNLGGEGIDQTVKFANLFPKLPRTGILAIQAECLIPLEHGFGEGSRAKANGLVNSKYLDLQVDMLACLQGFRYYLDPESPYSEKTSGMTYREVENAFPIVRNLAGDIKFSGSYVMTLDDLEKLGDQVEKDIWDTPSGRFLVDGLVAYSPGGICIQAFKYKSAGRGESTKVLGIKWNNQITKGKDSWSANALIEPVKVRGCEIKKPSVGSVKKMVEKGLSAGAQVTVILANSTIPQVSEVYTPGDLDYSWPTCSCGYEMSQKDIYGALLKCGNPMCSERAERMRGYLSSIKEFKDINLNKLLVIDRVKWEDKVDDLGKLMKELEELVTTDGDVLGLLEPYLNTELQKRNLALVIGPAILTLKEYVGRVK